MDLEFSGLKTPVSSERGAAGITSGCIYDWNSLDTIL